MSPTPPRYCPSCGHRPPAEDVADALRADPLCTACGATLKLQGYCPTCESYWSADVGSPCPKHDLPLESDPPAGMPGDLGGTRWTTVESFGHPTQAEAPRLRLEAEGIPTFLAGERMATQTLYNVAIGGVRLQVPEHLAADARVLLKQTWSEPPGADENEDPWEGLAPEPGRRRRSIMRGVIVFLLLWPVVVGVFTIFAAWLGR